MSAGQAKSSVLPASDAAPTIYSSSDVGGADAEGPAQSQSFRAQLASTNPEVAMVNETLDAMKASLGKLGVRTVLSEIKCGV